jgi:hypothetical protein
METKTKDLSIEINSLSLKTSVYIFLAAVVLIFPFFVHSQWLTGPMVNAALLISSLVINQSTAITLGLFPSSLALAGGLLPLLLAPMVPFIMISNALYIYIFNLTKGKKDWQFFLSIFSASLVKFLFLYSTVTYLMPNLLKPQILHKVSIMMSWPQFITAIAGGLISFIFYKASHLHKN